jgi:hypothetical protein
MTFLEIIATPFEINETRNHLDVRNDITKALIWGERCSYLLEGDEKPMSWARPIDC